MNKGTGRSAVSAAVTGHRKPKLKAGGGSLRTNPVASGSSSVSERRPVAKVRSALAKVSDRSGLFG
jgi:mediator of replication checkpoint protein 1